MKHFKRLMAVILILATFVATFMGSYHFFSHGTYDFDVKKLLKFDEEENSYYLQDAPPNIIFQLNSPDGKPSYRLEDSKGNFPESSIQRISKNGYNILPPTAGYILGESYTLTLSPNVQFQHEELINVRKLVFSIQKEDIEKYKFTDAVVTTDQKIQSTSENKIDISGLSVEEGQIVFGKDSEGESIAYKIEKVLNDNTASVSIPKADEIYSELEVYGEYTWDVKDVVANPDLEIEIAENFKKSEFFEALMIAAYADDKPRDGKVGVKVEHNPTDNSILIEIKTELEPGEKGLFGDSRLKNQKVSLTLSARVGFMIKGNIKGLTDWDISQSITTSFSWQVNITPYNAEWKNDRALEGLFSKDNSFANLIEYHKKAKKITEKLNDIAAEANAGELKLFNWKIPTSVPGLYFDAEIKLFVKFEMAAEITIGQSANTVYTSGIYFRNLKFNTYSNTYRNPGRDITLALRGKAALKSGVKLIIKATIVHEKVAYASIDPQVGLYAKVYATIPISSMEEINDSNFLYSYFEAGVYFSCDMTARMNLGFKSFDYSGELAELQYPISKLGNKKIAMGISPTLKTVRAIDNKLVAPNFVFEYLDVTKGRKATETLDLNQLKFVIQDGTKLSVKGNKIELPPATNSNMLYITANYTHTDKKTYSCLFKVLVSGGLLEGAVSAQNSNNEIIKLTDAQVKLYSGIGTSEENLITTAPTDEEGKFAFNVSAGEYTLEISAEGYQTLISNQHVEKDEIKYTEHILLMDNSQTGPGSAGGTVTNAINGRGLEGVALKLRPNWNNRTGPYYSSGISQNMTETDITEASDISADPYHPYETETNASGKYKIENVPAGYYTVEASLNGYVTGYSNIIVLSQNSKYDFDFTITPILNDSEVRIVLTWGNSPRDLDSHLIGRTPSDNTFNVYYADKVYSYDNMEMANLDVDDTTSYGPETVTILQNIYGEYIYAVHDYSNQSLTSSNNLSYSGALVRVFVGSRQVGEYHVPTDQIGTYWSVFKIDASKRIVPINSISNVKPQA